MRKLRILILYPDPAGLALLTAMLQSLGHIIEEATNDRVAVRLMARNDIDLVLAGVDPDDGDALEILTYVRRKHRGVPVVLLFPRHHPERAKEALRLGAMMVLKYPVTAAELRAAALQALEQCEARPSELTAASPSPSAAPAEATLAAGKARAVLAMERSGPIPPLTLHPATPSTASWGALGSSADASSSGGLASSETLTAHAPAAAGPAHRIDLIAQELGLIGNDPGWRQVLEVAATLAPARACVLIVGEPGTGKSMVARLLHALGSGRQRPFATIEASAVADELATTDPENTSTPPPVSADPGLIWSHELGQARGGTLYLDEVASLPAEIQFTLLRELQDRDYGAVAAYPQPPGEVRFLMSTSENLPALIEQGRFPQELFHRVSAISLLLPPLRHRGTDIELLAEWFRARYAQDFHKSVAGFTSDALDILQRHDWPGNIRELEAAVRRAVALCNGSRITSRHLAPILSHHRQARVGTATTRPHPPVGIRTLKEALEEPEKRIIIQALKRFNWNRQDTARVLEINRTTLYKRMKKYGLLID